MQFHPLKTAAAAAAVIAIGHAAASAQAADPGARQDVREGRAVEKPSRAEAFPALAVTPGEIIPEIGASIGFTGTSNLTLSTDDPIEAIYTTPGASFGASMQTKSAWTLHAGVASDGDYMLTGHHDFDETRLGGDLSASHALGPGAITLAYKALGSFDDFYEENTSVLQRYVASYGFKPTDKLSLQMVGEYYVSDIASARRSKLSLSGAYVFGPFADFNASVRQGFSYSAFRAGSNDGREDVLSQTTLSVSRPIYGWDVGLTLAYSHRFSNVDAAEFDSVDIGPVFERVF